MCGRFILLTDLFVILEYFHPDRNIAPGQQVSAVIQNEVNKLIDSRWGLIVSWNKDPSIGNRMINDCPDKASHRVWVAHCS